MTQPNNFNNELDDISDDDVNRSDDSCYEAQSTSNDDDKVLVHNGLHVEVSTLLDLQIASTEASFIKELKTIGVGGHRRIRR